MADSPTSQYHQLVSESEKEIAGVMESLGL